MSDTERDELVKLSAMLKEKHEQIKREMLKTLDASNLLHEQYVDLEKSLYAVEEKYVETVAKLTS